MSVLASPFERRIVTRASRQMAPISMRKAMQAATRGYNGAIYDRLTEDWKSPLTTGDAEMRTRLRTLRGRARELERNEPYSRRFLSRLEDNIYDYHGITFNSLAGAWKKANGQLKWEIDKLDAQIIQSAYAEWKKNPFVTKNMTLNEGGRLALRSTARDGDMFVKWVVDPSLNDFGFGLQLLEADMCDDYKNEVIRTTKNANKVLAEVRMGVQVDGFMRPEGYWMLKAHPGDQMWWTTDGYVSEFHSVDDFLHPFKPTRITQVRDVTWLCGIMRDLKMLDGYDEAAIVAARTGAAKMGFFTRGYNEPGDPFTGPRQGANNQGGDSAGIEGDQATYERGDLTMDAEPGLIEDLSQSPGLDFKAWDPAYPHEQYNDFMKVRLRRIGAGVDMSYYAIANDLTEVNFSSIRAGLLEDREHFKALQTWWLDKFECPIFLKWLEISLLNGAIKDPISGARLPFSKLQKFSKHKFHPRRWDWVDPQKDIEAAVTAIDNRLKTRDQVIQEHTQATFEEVVEGHQREQEAAEAARVELPPVAGAQPENASDETTPNEDGSEGKTPNGNAK